MYTKVPMCMHTYMWCTVLCIATYLTPCAVMLADMELSVWCLCVCVSMQIRSFTHDIGGQWRRVHGSGTVFAHGSGVVVEKSLQVMHVCGCVPVPNGVVVLCTMIEYALRIVVSCSAVCTTCGQQSGRPTCGVVHLVCTCVCAGE